MAVPGAPLIFRLMTRTIAAAHQAGRTIREVLSSGHLNIVTKEGDRNNLQTAADLAAQNCIVAALSREFPGIKIIAEEDEATIPLKTDDGSLVADVEVNTFESLSCPDDLKQVTSGQIVVWVDPLDGTSEFTQGLLEQVTVLIGVAVDGKPLAGVVHQPFWGQGRETTENGIGRSIWAIQGCGMGQHVGLEVAPDAPLKLSESPFAPTLPPADKVIVVTSRSRRSPLIESAVKALNPDEVICAGGCGNKILMLLEGRATHYVYASSGTKKWDTCAPDALLSQAGGVLSDVFGKPLHYGPTADQVNRQGVLAAVSAEQHHWALSVLPPELKDQL